MHKYEPVREIGADNFAAAKLMRNKDTRELVAMKFIERGNRIDENVFREIVNHRSLRHPNIIRFKEVVLTPTHLAIVMEYAAGGELFERICEAGRFHEDEARYLFQQLVCGVSFCHAMNICHRDLKLENTLLDGSPARRLKICDFVYSKSSVLHSRPKSTVGTPKYIAPEVLARREYDGKQADVWSCGVTLYVMLVGAYPFEDPKDPKNFRKTISRIMSVQYKIPEYVYVSQNCRHLLTHIFVQDPYKRITMSEIKSHPWYLENLPRELKEEAQAAYYNRRGGGDAGASSSGSSNGGGANAAAAYSSQSVEEIMRIVQEAQTVPKPAKPVSGYGSDHEDNAQYEEADAEEEEEEEAEQVDQQRASQPADQHGTRGIPATWEDAAALAVPFFSLSIEDTSQYMSATPGILTYRLLSDMTKGFSNEHKIGHGSFGEVYKGELPNGEKIAVKKLRQHLILVDDVQFKNEILILRNLKHHNIVQFVGYCHATEPVPVEINGKVILAERHQRALCFEYLQNGSLRNHLSEVSRGLNWQMRYEIIKGICEGLNYLHNGSEDGRHIYHMDLKPDNILLDENMVPKIADFGLSRLFSTTQSHTTVTSPGTPGYMPPEYIDTFKISNKFDIFSLGVIIIDIMIGPSSCRHEYDEASSDKDYSNLVQENWNRRLKATPSYTSQETDDSLKVKTCIEIALKCVKKDRVERPTISMILDTLKYIHTAQRSLLVDQARLVKFGLWGGKRGTRRDIKTAPRRLESVTIYSLDVIDALEFSYNDCNGQHHTAGPWGGAGGSPNKVQLHPSEVLVEMCGTVGPTDGIPNVITSLMLITDAGKYGPFGRGDGTPFRICMQNNGHIAGFFGRADEYVNAVGVYTNQEESRVGVCKVGPWGGEGGSTCDIDVPPHHVQSVTVRCSDHVIHSLAFSYSDRNGHHHTAGPWGGIGGEVHKIDLEPYEFLVEVSGTIGEFGGMQNLITSFTLVTNVATYGPFGEVRGTRFDIPVHSKSCIVGFFVRAGIFINAIGVYARPI